MVTQRHAIIESFARRWDSFDAIVCPTVPIIAPRISSLEASADEFRRTNLLLLRNPSIANFLDLCAISIPCHKPGDPPVGLMLTGKHGEDKRLLSLALAVENTLTQ
jgi:aspartyl-tRNA(Asn)/glutamyl-tRNA(Gln) amidotransferase subunit A